LDTVLAGSIPVTFRPTRTPAINTLAEPGLGEILRAVVTSQPIYDLISTK
jgi:hypothetical protein